MFIFVFVLSLVSGQNVDYRGRPLVAGEPVPQPEGGPDVNCSAVQCVAVTTCPDGSAPVKAAGECCATCPQETGILV